MHTDLADFVIAAPVNDLIGARGDQFADDRIASGIVRSDEFFAWCEQCSLPFAAIRPHDVATYIEQRHKASKFHYPLWMCTGWKAAFRIIP